MLSRNSIIGLVGLVSVLDVITTLIGFQYGGRELNPIMKTAFVSFGWVGLVLIKLLAFLVSTFFLFLIPDRYQSGVRSGILFGCVLLIGVVLSNIVWIVLGAWNS